MAEVLIGIFLVLASAVYLVFFFIWASIQIVKSDEDRD